MTHLAMAAADGVYRPTGLSGHDYRTLERLTDLIIPVENGAPGAVKAEVAAWIDMLISANDELKQQYTDGLAWVDAAMKRRGASDFIGATPAQQTALLDLIGYKKNQTAELKAAVEFFSFVRRMTVDGFYTSRVGMPDIYLGNRMLESFTVPTESLNYALKRSGLG
jgi:hypothetical protein|tara:strand:+ start:2082 stop:2579 length:498 start_codon:yes stop_codon:yes gene_type:complete